MGNLRTHLTYANVVSVISLLFALGLGGAWAASELGKNDVKSKHIGKGQVKRSDIAKNAVNSKKVADDGLSGNDIDEGRLGKVPTAGSADSATTAQSAASAASAENAGLLDNRDSASFAAADRFRFGTADHSAPTPQTLFSAGGITVQTDGDADTDSTVQIVNGTDSTWDISQDNPGIAGIPPGTAGAVSYSGSGRAGVVVLRNVADLEKAIFLACGNDLAPNVMECWGFLSPSV